ncbi:hypothetical protein CKA32_000084 [Geitlerinema sp. FC II]|nr:hypothetical protein CKA32_000084 [Geitlerinema sp. FC II]
MFEFHLIAFYDNNFFRGSVCVCEILSARYPVSSPDSNRSRSTGF